ncbi:MAG: hypothetical protein K2Q26_06180 [Bdellovibrionales bacterium]|nr:hypothetical protein [Bdellovibrionales bacterium]
MYRTALRREPSSAEVSYWAAEFVGMGSDFRTRAANLAHFFTTSTEFSVAYSDVF